MMDNPSTVQRLWCLALIIAFAMSPVYLWESGLPQPCHIIAAVAIELRILTRPRLYWVRGWSLGALFVLYSLTVAVVVYALHGDVTTVLAPAYYAFGFAVFLLTVTATSEIGRPFLRSIFWVHTCALTCVVAITASGAGRSLAAVRSMSTFNDPNQMANWLICCVCVLASTGRVLYNSWWPGLLGLAVAAVGVVFSASRSGSLGLLALTTGLLSAVAYQELRSAVSEMRVRLTKVLAIGMVASGLLVVVWLARSVVMTAVAGTLGQRVSYLISRFGEIVRGSGYAFWSARGYDRLLLFPEYLVFGAGEGAVERFAGRVWFLGEIHSSWVGVLFCYGFVGAALFAMFVASAVARIRDRWSRVLLLGPLVYGFTTYSIRNWYSWVALGVLVGSSLVVDRQRQGCTHLQCKEDAAGRPR